MNITLIHNIYIYIYAFLLKHIPRQRKPETSHTHTQRDGSEEDNKQGLQISPK